MEKAIGDLSRELIEQLGSNSGPIKELVQLQVYKAYFGLFADFMAIILIFAVIIGIGICGKHLIKELSD